MSLTPDAEDRVTLTVTRSGDGMGTVTSSDGTLNCGTECSVSVAKNTVVTLSAAADASSSFTGWNGGSCTGTDPCAVTVTADTTVDAAFGVSTGLTVTLVGGTNGRIVSTPSGIDCGIDCNELFPPGTMVTLTAVPGPEGPFMGWSGACSGMGPCEIMASGSQNVTATFACASSKAFAYTGGVQNFNIPACATSLTIDASGAQGGRGTAGSALVGGLGAHIVGTFQKTAIPSSVLKVLVGGAGGNKSYNGSGGGGSFVYINPTDPTPLVAAGGGGGVGNSSYSTCTAGAGSSTQSATPCSGGAGCSVGGSGGNGGAGGATSGGASPGTGGGGAGWLSNGGPGQVATAGDGGKAPRNGGAGGSAAATTDSAAGGFGGGGASAGSDGTGGGGGGFNGGGGGNGYNNASWGCGGGGGSYNGGANQTNQAGVQSGNGAVTITWQ